MDPLLLLLAYLCILLFHAGSQWRWKLIRLLVQGLDQVDVLIDPVAGFPIILRLIRIRNLTDALLDFPVGLRQTCLLWEEVDNVDLIAPLRWPSLLQNIEHFSQGGITP